MSQVPIDLWIGDHKRNYIADGKFLNAHDKVMDSLISYYKDTSPTIPYKYQRLFLDNGAYTAIRKGETLDIERVKKVQEEIDPEKTIPLDYPLLPGMPNKRMKELWLKSRENVLDWQETTRLKELVPVLHAWSVTSLIKHVRWLQNHADAEYIAIGSVVTSSFSKFGGYFGDRHPSKHLLDMIIHTVQQVRSLSDFRLHMAGFGSSPLMLHLGYYCALNSTDTTGYRRGAAYGKIIVPGSGWRFIGRKNASFGTISLTLEDKEKLQHCQCPVCRRDSGLLRTDWKARAVHNKYVLEGEEKLARKLISEDFEAYEKYLDEIFAKSSLRYLWRYVKARVNYFAVDPHL